MNYSTRYHARRHHIGQEDAIFLVLVFHSRRRADYCGKPSIDPRPFGSTIRDSGHLAVSTSGWVAGLIKPAQSPHAGLETRLRANQERKGRIRTSVLTSAHLGRPTEDSQGFKPDLGNPAVRDYRGAFGTVGHGGNEIPPRNRKSETGNPPPTAGAPELYPNEEPRGRKYRYADQGRTPRSSAEAA